MAVGPISRRTSCMATNVLARPGKLQFDSCDPRPDMKYLSVKPVLGLQETSIEGKAQPSESWPRTMFRRTILV